MAQFLLNPKDKTITPQVTPRKDSHLAAPIFLRMMLLGSSNMTYPT